MKSPPAERIGAGRDLVVIVVSDHGSTRIPAGVPNLSPNLEA
jgi:hypothetical protein